MLITRTIYCTTITPYEVIVKDLKPEIKELDKIELFTTVNPSQKEIDKAIRKQYPGINTTETHTTKEKLFGMELNDFVKTAKPVKRYASQNKKGDK